MYAAAPLSDRLAGIHKTTTCWRALESIPRGIGFRKLPRVGPPPSASRALRARERNYRIYKDVVFRERFAAPGVDEVGVP